MEYDNTWADCESESSANSWRSNAASLSSQMYFGEPFYHASNDHLSDSYPYSPKYFSTTYQTGSYLPNDRDRHMKIHPSSQKHFPFWNYYTENRRCKTFHSNRICDCETETDYCARRTREQQIKMYSPTSIQKCKRTDHLKQENTKRRLPNSMKKKNSNSLNSCEFHDCHNIKNGCHQNKSVSKKDYNKSVADEQLLIKNENNIKTDVVTYSSADFSSMNTDPCLEKLQPSVLINDSPKLHFFYNESIDRRNYQEKGTGLNLEQCSNILTGQNDLVEEELNKNKTINTDETILVNGNFDINPSSETHADFTDVPEELGTDIADTTQSIDLTYEENIDISTNIVLQILFEGKDEDGRDVIVLLANPKTDSIQDMFSDNIQSECINPENRTEITQTATEDEALQTVVNAAVQTDSYTDDMLKISTKEEENTVFFSNLDDFASEEIVDNLQDLEYGCSEQNLNSKNIKISDQNLCNIKIAKKKVKSKKCTTNNSATGSTNFINSKFKTHCHKKIHESKTSQTPFKERCKTNNRLNKPLWKTRFQWMSNKHVILRKLQKIYFDKFLKCFKHQNKHLKNNFAWKVLEVIMHNIGHNMFKLAFGISHTLINAYKGKRLLHLRIPVDHTKRKNIMLKRAKLTKADNELSSWHKSTKLKRNIQK